MSNLFQQFLWIALLQQRPQDVPAGTLALRVALCVNAITYVVAIASTRPIANSLVVALTDLAVSALCLYAAVAVMDKTPRFQQALTALAGGTGVLNLVAVPVLWTSASSSSPEVALLVNLAFVVWGLAIISHVLFHTLEVSRWASVGLAFGFYVVVLNVMHLTGVTGAAESDPGAELRTSGYQSVSYEWSRSA